MNWTRRNGTRIPRETIEGVRATRLAGASTKEAAELYGVDPGTVLRILRDPDFGSILAPEVERAVRNAASEGLGIAQTARRYGMDNKTVIRAAAIMGITMPDGRAGGRKLQPEDINPLESWAENARRLGVTIYAVRRCAGAHGIVNKAPYKTVLSLLSPEERDAYDTLRNALHRAKAKAVRRDILKAIGRGDLVMESV